MNIFLSLFNDKNHPPIFFFFRINDKQQLLRLITHLTHPGEALDGHFPAEGPIVVDFADIEAKLVKTEV